MCVGVPCSISGESLLSLLLQLYFNDLCARVGVLVAVCVCVLAMTKTEWQWRCCNWWKWLSELFLRDAHFKLNSSSFARSHKSLSTHTWVCDLNEILLSESRQCSSLLIFSIIITFDLKTYFLIIIYKIVPLLVLFVNEKFIRVYYSRKITQCLHAPICLCFISDCASFQVGLPQ